jgi:hypothetical protein
MFTMMNCTRGESDGGKNGADFKVAVISSLVSEDGKFGAHRSFHRLASYVVKDLGRASIVSRLAALPVDRMSGGGLKAKCIDSGRFNFETLGQID